MSDSSNKIFIWQLGIAAGVGIIWSLLWEIPSLERGFFFDLPWGIMAGFFWGIVAILVLAAIGGLVWALIRLIQGTQGNVAERWDGLGASWRSLGGVMRSDVDKLGESSAVSDANRWLDEWNSSAIAWGITWGVGLLLLWGMIGGLLWGFELGFVVRLVLVLLLSGAGAFGIAYAFDVTESLGNSLGRGYQWMDRVLSRIDSTWASWNLPERWGVKRLWEDTWGLEGFIDWRFAGAFAWAVAGFLAAGGLGAGIVQSIILALFALIGALVGGIASIQLKAKL